MKKSEEIEIINGILSYEEAMFAEYSNNLLKYQDDIQKLGVEIKSVVSRTRCLYGASKFYDLRAMNKLPHFYSGHI